MHRITSYGGSPASTLTCCGQRAKTFKERLLDFLGAVGGFGGMVQSVLGLVAGHAFLGGGGEEEGSGGGGDGGAGDMRGGGKLSSLASQDGIELQTRGGVGGVGVGVGVVNPMVGTTSSTAGGSVDGEGLEVLRKQVEELSSQLQRIAKSQQQY